MNKIENDIETLTRDVTTLADKARVASRALALVETEVKNRALQAMAHAILASQTDILRENAKDLEAGSKAGLSHALIDRLTLNDDRIAAIAKGLHEMVHLPDPVGEVLRAWTRPNGLSIQQIRVPLGVIGMIYAQRGSSLIT